MKHNHNHDKAPNTQLVPVHLEFTDPKAISVCIAGKFNHWQPEAKTLKSSGVGNWWKETSLAPGTYEYGLIVDGKWMSIPIKQLPSGLGLARFSAFSSPAVVPAIVTDFIKAESTAKSRKNSNPRKAIYVAKHSQTIR